MLLLLLLMLLLQLLLLILVRSPPLDLRGPPPRLAQGGRHRAPAQGQEQGHPSPLGRGPRPGLCLLLGSRPNLLGSRPNLLGTRLGLLGSRLGLCLLLGVLLRDLLLLGSRPNLLGSRLGLTEPCHRRVLRPSLTLQEAPAPI